MVSVVDSVYEVVSEPQLKLNPARDRYQRYF